jgi:hypothetical protein
MTWKKYIRVQQDLKAYLDELKKRQSTFVIPHDRLTSPKVTEPRKESFVKSRSLKMEKINFVVQNLLSQFSCRTP